MFVVIFAGGRGTRLMEETRKAPKPMVKIGPYPIIEHLVQTYTKYGFNKFIFLTGYKSKDFYSYFKKKKNFFIDYEKGINSNLYIKFKSSSKKNKIYIKTLYTGINTNKKNRLLKAKKYLIKDKFFLTYGDGLSNIDYKKLLKFHNDNNQICTLSAINPPQRFGVLKISGSLVKKFSEKKSLKKNFINGGFFVCNPSIFNFLKKNNSDFEENTLPLLAKQKKLAVYKHKGFWYSMDTLRDKIYLTKLYHNNAPWK
tara:strand:+ start:1021 stop:1785 length:765 start_codon:yes stop_codon:yes gene_type:complete